MEVVSNKASLPSRSQPDKKQGEKEAREKVLMQKAKEFEANFMAEVLGNMSQGLKTDGMFGGGYAEDTFRTFLNMEYAKAMVSKGNTGIADRVYRELSDDGKK